jgi:hypothetical protein
MVRRSVSWLARLRAGAGRSHPLSAEEEPQPALASVETPPTRSTLTHAGGLRPAAFTLSSTRKMSPPSTNTAACVPASAVRSALSAPRTAGITGLRCKPPKESANPHFGYLLHEKTLLSCEIRFLRRPPQYSDCAKLSQGPCARMGRAGEAP